MIRLPETLSAWATAGFNDTLRREVEALGHEQLPLQQGLARSSHVAAEPFGVRIIAVAEEPHCLVARLGILYAGIIAGCSCADDPTPVDSQTEYCEVRLVIDKATAEARFTLLEDYPG
jgi:hypothetical protein